jgi:hypothetical protein
VVRSDFGSLVKFEVLSGPLNNGPCRALVLCKFLSRTSRRMRQENGFKCCWLTFWVRHGYLRETDRCSGCPDRKRDQIIRSHVKRWTAALLFSSRKLSIQGPRNYVLRISFYLENKNNIGPVRKSANSRETSQKTGC